MGDQMGGEDVLEPEGLSYSVMSGSDLGICTGHFLSYFSFSFSVILEFKCVSTLLLNVFSNF